MFIDCDGPATCPGMTCCLGNPVAIGTGTTCPKKAADANNPSAPLHTYCTTISLCTDVQYVVCSKTGDPCPNAKTCTTIEVAIPSQTKGFLLDVCL